MEILFLSQGIRSHLRHVNFSENPRSVNDGSFLEINNLGLNSYFPSALFRVTWGSKCIHSYRNYFNSHVQKLSQHPGQITIFFNLFGEHSSIRHRGHPLASEHRYRHPFSLFHFSPPDSRNDMGVKVQPTPDWSYAGVTLIYYVQQKVYLTLFSL